jgi:hypothetical protein
MRHAVIPPAMEVGGLPPAQKGRRNLEEGLVMMARRLMVVQDLEVRILYYKRQSTTFRTFS